MNRNHLLSIVCLVIVLFQGCQSNVKNEIKGISLDEPAAPQEITPTQNWETVAEGLNISWGSSNERYHKEYIPEVKNNTQLEIWGWKNERLNAQIVVWGNLK